MMEAELKEKMIPIFAGGPTEENTKAMQSLLMEASETISAERMAILAGEALDEAYPDVSSLRQQLGMPTAAEKMQQHVDNGEFET